MGMKPDTYYQPVSIYYLSDPDTGEVKYVGQTCRPKTRVAAHIATARIGKAPTMTVLEVIDSTQADQREQFWIGHFIGQGAELLNGKHHLSAKCRSAAGLGARRLFSQANPRHITLQGNPIAVAETRKLLENAGFEVYEL